MSLKIFTSVVKPVETELPNVSYQPQNSPLTTQSVMTPQASQPTMATAAEIPAPGSGSSGPALSDDPLTLQNEIASLEWSLLEAQQELEQWQFQLSNTPTDTTRGENLARSIQAKMNSIQAEVGQIQLAISQRQRRVQWLESVQEQFSSEGGDGLDGAGVDGAEGTTSAAPGQLPYEMIDSAAKTLDKITFLEGLIRNSQLSQDKKDAALEELEGYRNLVTTVPDSFAAVLPSLELIEGSVLQAAVDQVYPEPVRKLAEALDMTPSDLAASLREKGIEPDSLDPTQPPPEGLLEIIFENDPEITRLMERASGYAGDRDIAYQNALDAAATQNDTMQQGIDKNLDKAPFEKIWKILNRQDTNSGKMADEFSKVREKVFEDLQA
ncbi:MAG: hypothetical protein Q7S00_00640, partial [bacterium]|nr:hypothetical protein [bacterium]